MKHLAALLIGESVLFYGLFVAWAPLAFIALGLQVVAGVLLSEHEPKRGDA